MLMGTHTIKYICSNPDYTDFKVAVAQVVKKPFFCVFIRYLLRTVKHPILLKDPDVLQFLESSEVK